MSEPKITRRQFLKTLGIGGAAALIASYPVFIERYMIQINRYTIPLPSLPEAFEGFTIVHLSDLHYGAMPITLIEWVIQQANALEKDMIVGTGDFVFGRKRTDRIDTIWPLLSQLEAPSGVYSVLGNHDHWTDGKRSLFWLEKSGQNLRHRSIPIHRNEERIWFGGAGDLFEDEPGIDQAFAGVPQDEFKIMLAHNPDTADRPYETSIDLFLCGHTHGGQVNLPLIGAPVLPVHNRRYVSGFVQSPKTNLFISRGVGTASVPFRFNCPPEIAVLTLQKRA